MIDFFFLPVRMIFLSRILIKSLKKRKKAKDSLDLQVDCD